MALLQGQFYSKELKRLVAFSAILPVDTIEMPGAAPAENKGTIKTLYLLHGYSGMHTDWLYGSRIQELALKHRIAVIMPSGDNSFYLDQKEREDFYGGFIGRELPEMAGKLFHLSDKKEDTFIGGLSMGGYGALRNGLKYNERFGGIIALSSALIANNITHIEPDFRDGIASYGYYRHVFGELKSLPQSDNHPEKLVRDIKEMGAYMPAIYMACGTEDFLLEENRHFHEFLKNQQVAHVYLESSGTHDWKFWDAYIEKAVEWMINL